jgi:hypothetical protein
MSVKRTMKELIVEWKFQMYSAFVIVLFVSEVFFFFTKYLVVQTTKHTKWFLQRSPMVQT